jgi:type IV pilus assembly protein PilC
LILGLAMPQYAYRAVNPNGRQLRGALAAANERDLHQALGAIGLELIDCRLLAARRSMMIGRGRLDSRELIQLCIHLEQLQRAGVPLLEGLADVRDSTDVPRLRDLAAEIHRDVSEGQPLSVAFAKHPKVFGNLFTALISAGEATGKLADSFHQLARHLKWTAAMGSKVRKATRYPAVVACVVLGVTVFMMAGVVPQVVEFLAANNQTLPIWTEALIATSNFVRDFWPLLVGLPPVAFVLVRILARRSAEFAYRLDALLLRLPVGGKVLRKLALARFAQMFAVMFQSGIDILACLDAGRKVTGNRVLSEALGLVRQQVQVGSTLSAAMAASGEFPSRVCRMVKIGEETGNLTETLSQVAEFYDQDVDASIDAMISLIEPALTAVLGLVMAWIALAVFGPIYDSLDQLGA